MSALDPNAVLHEAADKFREYAQIHTLKIPNAETYEKAQEIAAKADANEAMAQKLDEAIALVKARLRAVEGAAVKHHGTADKLRAAIRRAGYAVMQTSGEWSIHDTREPKRPEKAIQDALRRLGDEESDGDRLVLESLTDDVAEPLQARIAGLEKALAEMTAMQADAAMKACRNETGMNAACAELGRLEARLKLAGELLGPHADMCSYEVKYGCDCRTAAALSAWDAGKVEEPKAAPTMSDAFVEAAASPVVETSEAPDYRPWAMCAKPIEGFVETVHETWTGTCVLRAGHVGSCGGPLNPPKPEDPAPGPHVVAVSGPCRCHLSYGRCDVHDVWLPLPRCGEWVDGTPAHPCYRQTPCPDHPEGR